MRYVSENQLNRFAFLDRQWQILSWTEDVFSVRVEGPDVVSGEFAGQRIADALVTFRGIRLKHVFTHDGTKEYSLTRERAVARFAGVPLFVFSFYPENRQCEFCGLSDGDPIAVSFDYEGVTVEWEAFSKSSAGHLVRE